jgi:hypothetical protein
MTINADYVAAMQGQLKNWDIQVDALVAEGKQANAFLAAKYETQINELRTSREAAQVAFKKIRMASDAGGGELQAGMAKAWLAMEERLAEATATLHGTD